MWGKIVNSVSSVLDINQATLSGSTDIIVVSQNTDDPDDDASILRSTPFHVRFGKAKLLRSREKIVTVTVNGIVTPMQMKLGAAGEAYFVHETYKKEERKSSISSPGVSPTEDDSLPTENITFPTEDHFSSQIELSTPKNEWLDGKPPQSLTPDNVPHPQKLRSLTFSLCGHLVYGTPEETFHDNEIFNANIVSYEQMDQTPALWYHPYLLAKSSDQDAFFPAKLALPLLASWTAFNRPLSPTALENLLNVNVVATEQPKEEWVGPPANKVASEGSNEGSDVDEESDSRVQRSLRPTSEQLKELKLLPGPNHVSFTVTSSLQGTKSVSATIYLWSRHSKIVISDVDGTITRSDVLGQLMPIVGRDWSHQGVADLFTKVRTSGYLILYLTARAIGQADSTRDYLFGLTQDNKQTLPDGPLILSPDRLFPSFKREVIDRKPYIFKIAALRDIRNLFAPSHNPFYAGFGNRDSDHRAYVHVGVPEGKVFIIDPRGRIHHVNTTYAKTYESMSSIADQMFPSVGDSVMEADDSFNNLNFWKLPIAALPSQASSESELTEDAKAENEDLVVNQDPNLSEANSEDNAINPEGSLLTYTTDSDSCVETSDEAKMHDQKPP